MAISARFWTTLGPDFSSSLRALLIDSILSAIMRNEDYKSKENEYIITVWRLRSVAYGRWLQFHVTKSNRQLKWSFYLLNNRHSLQPKTSHSVKSYNKKFPMAMPLKLATRTMLFPPMTLQANNYPMSRYELMYIYLRFIIC